VVQLRPRQWLDNEEELVPIGGSTTTEARDHAASAPETAAESSSGPAPWAASDFWSEDAALVQDALEVPVPEVVEGPEIEGPGLEAPSAALAAGASQPLRSRVAGVRRSFAVPAAAAFAVAATAIGLIVVNVFGSAAGSPRRIAGSAASPATGFSIVGAPTTITNADRLRASRAARPERKRSQIRARSRSTATRRAARSDHHTPVTATAEVTARYSALTPHSTPAPITEAPLEPSHATSESPPTRSGPTGPVSLIGAGTSSSG
jgi:hypothetical protein